MAILFAATYPERTERLALVASFARIVEAATSRRGFPRELLEQFVRDSCASTGAHGRVLAPFAPTAGEDPAVREWGRRLLRSGSSPRGRAELLQLYLEIDVRHVLPAIQVPTLVVHRERRPDRPGRARPLHRRAHPAARATSSLPGDDHIPFVGDAGRPARRDRGARHRGRAPPATPTACWPPSSSPTSARRPSGPPRWGTRAGATLLTEHDRIVRHGGRAAPRSAHQVDRRRRARDVRRPGPRDRGRGGDPRRDRQARAGGPGRAAHRRVRADGRRRGRDRGPHRGARRGDARSRGRSASRARSPTSSPGPACASRTAASTS